MATTTPAAKAKTTPKKKKDLKLDSCILHVKTTDNNTLIVLSDQDGNKIL